MDNVRGIGIIGGGRWSRQIGKTLLEITTPEQKISVCSPNNTSAWTQWITEMGEICENVEVVSSIGPLLEDSQISHIIIARRAHNHAETAIRALTANKYVFIEKPFAVSGQEGERVIAAAEGKVCVTGLVMLFAPNLRRFASFVEKIGILQEIRLTWFDPIREQRHGETKHYDAAINVVLDALPHALSVLHHVHLLKDGKLKAVEVQRGGRVVTLKVSAKTTTANLAFQRDAKERVRRLELTGSKGYASIDFSQEPGVATLNGVPVDVAEGFSSPLKLELENFLSLTPQNCVSRPENVTAAIEAIRLSDLAIPHIRQHQIDCITASLNATPQTTDSSDCEYALNELVASGLAATGDRGIDRGLQSHFAEEWLRSGIPPQSVHNTLLKNETLLKIRRRLEG